MESKDKRDLLKKYKRCKVQSKLVKEIRIKRKYRNKGKIKNIKKEKLLQDKTKKTKENKNIEFKNVKRKEKRLI